MGERTVAVVTRYAVDVAGRTFQEYFEPNEICSASSHSAQVFIQQTLVGGTTGVTGTAP